MVELDHRARQEDFVRDPVIDQHTEIVRGMNGFVEKQLSLFSSPDRVWQPSDFLPDLSQEDGPEKLRALQEQAKNLSDDVLVVIAGAFITENALPTYLAWLNRIPGVKDETGTDNISWAIGNRFWTADESRHPIFLNGYMSLSGRLNMRAVYETSQHLIRSGFDLKTGKDPYKAISYVSIQEPGTQVSHLNAGLMAEKQGDETASKGLRRLSGDENRHKAYYHALMKEIVRVDPDGAVVAIRDVLIKQGMNMPGMLMTHDGIVPSSGKPSPLYEQLSNASIRCGAYTPSDYMRIVIDFLEQCDIENLSVSGDAAKAQEELGTRVRLYKRAIERFTPKPTSDEINLVSLWLK